MAESIDTVVRQKVKEYVQAKQFLAVSLVYRLRAPQPHDFASLYDGQLGAQERVRRFPHDSWGHQR